MKKLLLTTCVAAMMLSCNQQKNENPLFSESTAPFGAPMFELIEPAHYMPAYVKGFEEHNEDIMCIINSTEAPTFENTIAALDRAGVLLDKVGSVFGNMTSAETNDDLIGIQRELSPLSTSHFDNIMLNDQLFERVKCVYDNQEKENLTEEQTNLLDKKYKQFISSGALLSAEDKEKLKEINKNLSLLYIKFSNNVLNETNAFKLVIEDEAQLAGLPQWVRDGAAEEAVAKGEKGKWVFTLAKPSLIPFLQYSDVRELREKMYTAYNARGNNNNENDNKEVVKQILQQRLERAQLLGFDTYADMALDNRMAKNPENVYTLLNKIWDAALPKAQQEAAELQKMIKAEGGDFKLAGWDWWYYTEKVRKEKYALDESEIKPYFAVDNVREGAFMVANNLWGIKFKELYGMPVYHQDVKVFEVLDTDDSHIGIFYVDYFPRPGKKAGAWMSSYRDQYVENGKDIRPIIVNVGNFSKPVGDTPSLLNIDEVETLFHEFGHGLHGLLTKCNYAGVSGTSVARDFVELPSQIMEHWATHPEVLKMYAKHYQTGEVISDELIEKISKASNFNNGFTTTELVAAAILDLDMHTQNSYEGFNALAAEKETAKRIGLIDEIAFRYNTTFFNHIFSSEGYAAGYYSYLWAEVLDADAFDAFVENGIFDQATAKLFRENILEKGGSVEPMKLYRNFRGQDPNPETIIHNK